MKKNLFKRTGLLTAGDNLQNELKKLKFVLLVVFNCLSLSLFAQQRITGTISSRDSLLEGVTIQVKGGTAATQTDAKGNFTITAPSNATLVITIVGYADQEVKVGNRSTINVQLQPSTSQLTDVVVVGYGTQRKATVTGAVTAVRGTELDKSPGLNLSNSLAGRLPGVTAMQRSGEPGFDASTIRIRGTNTLGNSGPLIVIDGVPDRAGGLDRLNPADVENVSVLKDASAAIYGARAANGVILITTKQGKAGKPLVSYDFSNGWQQPTIVPKMGNAAQYAELLNEQVMFSNIPANQWEAAWQALKTTGSYTRTDNAQKVNAFYSPEDIQKFTNGSSPLTHPNTDWYRAVFKDWSGQQQHSLQISGGSEAIKFLASAGYQNQDAYYKNSATGYKQYDMRINLEARVNKYISATLGLTAREEFRFFPTVGAGDIFRMLIRGKPTEMAVWPNGLPGPDIENGQNPVVVTTGQTGYDRDRRDYFQTNGQIEIRNPWVEGLKFTLQGAADKLVRRTKRFQTPWALYFWDKVSYEDANKTIPKLTRTVRSTFSDPMLRLADEEELRINLTGMVNYDRVIGEGHTISFLAGVQKETRRGDNFFAYRRNFISPAVDQLNVGGTAQQDVGGTGFEQARLSYFGRAAYNYREKYLAEVVWRYDGSYIFPEVGRFGFFPGVLVGWNISKENFFQNVKAVNNLKLRGSYGQLGNDRVEFNGVLQEYAYLSTYSLSGVQVINGQQQRSLTEVRVPNTNFTWEVANNANIGLEGALFNNKITFELDVFRNLRKQILIARAGSTPQSTGITSLLPPVNEGKVENKGWEFRVGYNGRAGKDLTFNVSVNGGYAKNKVLFWDENPGVPKWQQATGHPFGTNGYAFLAYQYDGAFRDAKEIADNKIDYSAATNNLRPGDMKFIDYNGDGKINNLDQVRIDRTRDPRFTGGVNINVAYKNFDLSVLFQAATGGLQLLNFNETGEFGNWLQYSYNNRWSVDNPSSVDPRLVSRQNTYYTSGFRNNTYWLRSNDYLRFKNFEFGYTLGGRVGERVGISRLRLYVSGLNLVTWQKLAIWDPEETAENGYVYPQARIINAGVRVTF
jgi:TonB-linked SusC/RagA family outer membrane protein